LVKEATSGTVVRALVIILQELSYNYNQSFATLEIKSIDAPSFPVGGGRGEGTDFA
jgi:hypothetical protein